MGNIVHDVWRWMPPVRRKRVCIQKVREDMPQPRRSTPPLCRRPTGKAELKPTLPAYCRRPLWLRATPVTDRRRVFTFALKRPQAFVTCRHTSSMCEPGFLSWVDIVLTYGPDSCLGKCCPQVEVVIKFPVSLKWAALSSNWFWKRSHVIP